MLRLSGKARRQVGLPLVRSTIGSQTPHIRRFLGELDPLAEAVPSRGMAAHRLAQFLHFKICQTFPASPPITPAAVVLRAQFLPTTRMIFLANAFSSK